MQTDINFSPLCFHHCIAIHCSTVRDVNIYFKGVLNGGFNTSCYFSRPGKPGSTATGRGVLSLNGLSYGVVRVDKEGSVTSLTLQDCGTVPSGGKSDC